MDGVTMSVKVRVPPCLRRVTDPSVLEVSAGSLADCIEELERRLPGIKSQLCDDEGKILCSAFDFYINSTSTYPSKLAIPLQDGDDVIIFPLELDFGG
jgi:sulfur-carrier protein